MSHLSLDQIQKRFPIGDYIEYQTGVGFFSGKIIGYVDDRGLALDLGDRRFAVDTEKFYKYAEEYHVPAQLKEERIILESVLKHQAPAVLVQLTLF